MRAAMCIVVVIAVMGLKVFGDSPTTAPADGPLAAFESMIVAMEKEDLAGVNAAVVFDENFPIKGEDVVGYMKAVHGANRAARERFGESAGEVMPSEQMLRHLIAATRLQVEGDEAALVQGPKDGPVKVLTFKKIDDKWKVAFLPMVTTTGGDAKEQFLQFTRAIDETATEIKDGKFTTADEARARINQRMAEQMAPPPPAEPAAMN